MLFTIEQDVLADALAAPVRVSNSRATASAVGGVLVEAVSGALVLAGTDGETTVRVAVPADVVEAGTTLLSARRLFDVVRALNGRISMSTSGGQVSISASRFEGEVRALPIGNFPALRPIHIGNALISVHADVFAEAVAQTTPAVDMNEKYPMRGGFRLETGPGILQIVTTDGVRLAKVVIPNGLADEVNLTVPRLAIYEATRMKGIIDVSIDREDDTVWFKAPRRVISAKMLLGNYPEYRRILPDHADNVLRVNRQTLIDSIRRVTLLADDAPVILRFPNNDDGPGPLKIGSISSDARAADELTVDYIGAEMQIAFTPSLLLDGLEAVRDETVTIGFNGSDRPVKIGDEDYTYVIMPVRIRTHTGVVS